jgi:hypothetical protein
MPPALVSQAYGLLNATGGGGWDALAALTGDSLTIPSFREGTGAWILEAWAGNSVTKCQFSIRSPKMHDSTRGIRMAYQFNPTLSGADGDPQLLLPPYIRQPLYRTDTLVIETLATANDDVNLILLEWFEDLEGVAGDFRHWSEIESQIVDMVGILVTPTAGASNAYGTAEALNTDDDRLKADTKYALLGLSTDLPCTSIGIKGPNTGNQRIACPASWDPTVSLGWFVNLSRMYGLPTIPVINSNNKSVTFVDAVSSTTTLAPLVTLIFGELARS